MGETVDQIKTRVIGVDIRETKTTFALVNIRGEIIAQDYFRTSDYAEVSDYVTALSEKLLAFAEENGGYETIRSVGISAPSANFKTGCIENAANLNWKGVVPLAAMLRDQLGLAVALANDAHITALGEKAFGSAHGLKDFIVVSISHGGLGSCIFSNGQPHLGVSGFAGEVGHTCVKVGGRQCGCGRKGCLETYVSDKGLVKTAQEEMAKSQEPTLLSKLHEMNIYTITDCCEKGDKVAIETFNRVGTMLGLGLANYASVINPEAIILTGEQTQVYKWLGQSLEEAFEANVFGNIRDKVKMVVSTFDNEERDVLGASALAWTVKEYSLFL